MKNAFCIFEGSINFPRKIHNDDYSHIEDDYFESLCEGNYVFITERDALKYALKKIDSVIQQLNDQRRVFQDRLIELPKSEEEKEAALKWVDALRYQ